MRNNEIYNTPSGTVTLVLHKGGEYDLKNNRVINGEEIARKEIKNLIVNEASKFMAIRMAPGKTKGTQNGPNYSPGLCDGEFESVGLQYLAVGVGICQNPNAVFHPNTNPVNTDKWNLQAPPGETLTTTKLVGEYFRKKFTDWKFVDAMGQLSATPTNVLVLSTTYLEHEAVGPLTEMGLFGGDAATATRNTGHMFNYKTFAVWNKPNDSRLSIIWKLTF